MAQSEGGTWLAPPDSSQAVDTSGVPQLHHVRACQVCLTCCKEGGASKSPVRLKLL